MAIPAEVKMDDELEDEVIYQTLLAHLKIISRISINLPSTSTVVRHMRLYLVKPETIIACGLVLLVLLLAFNSIERWCKPAVDAVQKLAVSFRIHCERYANVSRNTRSVVNSSPSFLDGDGSKTTWELTRRNVGVYAMKGRRPKMEDRFSVISDDHMLDQDDKSRVCLYGVFDGHGGDFAANYVEKNLLTNLMKRIEQRSFPGDVNFSQLLTEEILAIDKQLMDVAKTSRDLSGTTALVALVHGSKLFVANVGDSRGVICDSRGLTIPLSFDHKPQRQKEQKRINEAGGIVTFNGVWRVAGILAISRALGDYPLKDRNLIIADPDVLIFNIDDIKPKFMILASDGLWDIFTNEEAVAFVKNRLHEADHGAKSLTIGAYERGSLDNISVVVVKFDQDP